jgi:Protein of unknown function (DUF3429)
MTDPQEIAVRQAATVLGVGGVIPFIGLAVCAWIDPAVLSESMAGTLLGPSFAVAGLIQHILSVYGVAILSFVGALHWGFVLAAPRRMVGSPVLALVWSILPSIYGWVVVSLIDLPRAFWWLAGGFAVAFVADAILYPRYANLPDWFIRLRLTLSLAAIASLVATAFAP